MGFDLYNLFLKIQKSIGTPTPKVGTHLGVWRFIPSHSPTLPKTWDVTLRLPFWPAHLQAFCFGRKPKVRVATILMSNLIEAMSSYTSIVTTLQSSILNHNPINFWSSFTFSASKQNTFVCPIVNKSRKNTCISPTNNISEAKIPNGHLASSLTTFRFFTFNLWIMHSPWPSTPPTNSPQLRLDKSINPLFKPFASYLLTFF